MRLEIFNSKLPLSAWLITQAVRFLNGFSPDIIKVFLYRKEFFGDIFQPGVREVLRGDSEWTFGERELMAAFVSSKNQCRYCTDAHRATAAKFVGDEVAKAVVESAETAAISDKLRVTLEFLDVLTVSPRSVTKEHIEAMRKAGVSKQAMLDAASVCAHFCIINRLADTFDFRLQTPRQLENEAKALATKHYKF